MEQPGFDGIGRGGRAAGSCIACRHPAGSFRHGHGGLHRCPEPLRREPSCRQPRAGPADFHPAGHFQLVPGVNPKVSHVKRGGAGPPKVRSPTALVTAGAEWSPLLGCRPCRYRLRRYRVWGRNRVAFKPGRDAFRGQWLAPKESLGVADAEAAEFGELL